MRYPLEDTASGHSFKFRFKSCFGVTSSDFARIDTELEQRARNAREAENGED